MIEDNAKYQKEEKKPDIFKPIKKEESNFINNNTENFIEEKKIKKDEKAFDFNMFENYKYIINNNINYNELISKLINGHKNRIINNKLYNKIIHYKDLNTKEIK